MVRILAIESSCDETAAAVVRDGRWVEGSAIASQIPLHQAYGAAGPQAQRPAVEDFMYWRYIAGLLESALTATP